jgi:hypothetical protein
MVLAKITLKMHSRHSQLTQKTIKHCLEVSVQHYIITFLDEIKNYMKNEGEAISNEDLDKYL